jgi:hypothetical protein
MIKGPLIAAVRTISEIGIASDHCADLAFDRSPLVLQPLGIKNLIYIQLVCLRQRAEIDVACWGAMQAESVEALTKPGANRGRKKSISLGANRTHGAHEFNIGSPSALLLTNLKNCHAEVRDKVVLECLQPKGHSSVSREPHCTCELGRKARHVIAIPDVDPPQSHRLPPGLRKRHRARFD